MILRFINKIEPFRGLLLHANCGGSSGVVFFGVLGVLCWCFLNSFGCWYMRFILYSGFVRVPNPG